MISRAVWQYFRFPPSLWLLEASLAIRGIAVSYETIRQWGLRFGLGFANRIRRRALRRGDKSYVDKVALTMAGKLAQAVRAVDQPCFVFDVSPEPAQPLGRPAPDAQALDGARTSASTSSPPPAGTVRSARRSETT